MHDLMIEFESVTPDLWIANEEEWKAKLLKLPNWFQIPLINCNASHNLADGTLVRFRGMVQDMRNPEFYFDKFEVFNTATNETKIKSGKYRDTANILENEKINYTQNLISSQRQPMVVVSLPGYNDWAHNVDLRENHLKHLGEQPNTSKRLNQASLKLKRSYQEADDDPDVMDVVDETVSTKEPRTADTQESSTSVVSREHLLNFPLPGVPSKSCIVKVYSESDNLKLNEMIEVVGFLSVDPALSGEFQPEQDPLLNPACESEAEIITHNPPPSLVPRLHAVYVKKLEHCNPLVKSFNQEEVLRGAETARQHLLKVLTELLLGDELAAEYLVCHLIASVYGRHETQALGRCSVNVSGAPPPCAVARRVYALVRRVATRSHFVPLSVHNLNTLALLPKKDYECNRLTSGVLQLSPGTHLVLDETALTPGRLGPAGLDNVAALGRLILTQTVQYDFKYYTMDFEADIPVLIISEGKSLLPSDYHVPLRADPSSVQMYEATLEAVHHYLNDTVLRSVREYLTAIKLVPFSISEDVQFVQDDFIEMRSQSSAENPVTAEDLHRLLVLARLVCLARGGTALSRGGWRLARGMEARRLQRLRDPLAP